MEKKLIRLGQALFLVGVALLIIRNNTYPWPIKRSSDVLFFLSLISIFSYLTYCKVWRTYIASILPVLKGLALIFFGLTLGTVLSFFTLHRLVDGQGVLIVFRYIECSLLLLAVIFFQSHDAHFYRKVALAQLSTLVYLLVFIVPNHLDLIQYRFELFENWPSNVGYYVVFSLSLLFTFLFSFTRASQPFSSYSRKQVAALSVGAIGLIAILLWTASRASWLSFICITFYLLVLNMYHSKHKILTFLGAVFMIFLFSVSGFFILPRLIQDQVIVRVFPGLQSFLYEHGLFEDVRSQDLVHVVVGKNLLPDLYDPSRPALWKAYSKLILTQPLGFGVNAPVLEYDGAPRGPHNTLLEVLVFAGPFGLVGYLYLVWLAMGAVMRDAWSDGLLWVSYVSAALIGLFIVSQFDNMSMFRLLWIFLGLGMSFPIHTRNLPFSITAQSTSSVST